MSTTQKRDESDPDQVLHDWELFFYDDVGRVKGPAMTVRSVNRVEIFRIASEQVKVRDAATYHCKQIK